MTAEQIRDARDLLTRPDDTVSSIARLLGVSRATFYKYVPELPRGPGNRGPAPRVEETEESAPPHGPAALARIRLEHASTSGLACR
jgi:transposase-like protein